MTNGTVVSDRAVPLAAMVKYLSEVTFLPVRTGGYWEDQGYEWFAGV